MDVCASGNYDVSMRVCQPSAAVQRWRKENKDAPEGIVLSAVRAETTMESPTMRSAPAWVREKYSTPTE